MAGEGKSAYDFDVGKQPATMLIQARPGCYFKINGRLYHPERQTVVGPDSKNRVRWEYEGNAQVWVPPEIGNQLIKTEPTEKTGPMATLVRTRTQEEALPTRKAKKPEADTADGTNKAVEDEPGTISPETTKEMVNIVEENVVAKKRRKPKEKGVLEDLPYNQLQMLAAEKGIKSFGAKKADLIAALKEAE